MIQNRKTFARFLRNPLVVFGLILLAGDGPLVVGYGLSRGTDLELVFAIAFIVFVFGMGGFFCFMVLRHTRRLFSPEEIPLEAIGRSIFSDSDKTIQEGMDEVRKKVEAKTAAEIKKLMKQVSDRFADIMALAGTTQPTIERLRPDIEVLVREAVASTRRVESEGRKAEESAEKAYVSAMQAIQGFFSCVDIIAGGHEMPLQVKETQRRLMVTGSLLQIQFGNSEDVITAANNVYKLAPNNIARSALYKGLKRKDLSPEAVETLRSRLRELKTRSTE